MKKTVYTLSVDNYTPEITELTFPLIARYAEKIGADFHIISDRKSPEMPPVYEKLQIFDIGKSNDWNIFIDADTLVHPEMLDYTAYLNMTTVLHQGADPASIRWKYDRHMTRDGRHIGSCNWFTIASGLCIDLWAPLDISLEEALSNIFPVVEEINFGMDKSHLIDDYTLSRNIAKYGLKFTTGRDILNSINLEQRFLWHNYMLTTDKKIEGMKQTIIDWKI